MINDAPPNIGQVQVNTGGGRNWARWRDIPLAVLAWIALVIVVLWLASHIADAILVLIIAALLAYALAPMVKLLERFMPRPLAIGLVYLLVLGGLGGLLYVSFNTAIAQFTSLAGNLQDFQNSPLTKALHRLGLSQVQIDQLGQQVINQGQGIANSIVPFLLSTATVILDVIVVTVLSIYLLIDGMRVNQWLRGHTPLVQRERVWFILDTIERIVGGYIRGQVILATLVGVLVGVGLQVIGVHYAVLLGVLAFVLEFIPYLGTLTSGAVCVLVALAQNPLLAAGVLVYFVLVHIFEGDIVGPRIVGKAVGLHPAVSLFALLAGAELFGAWGALFAAPIAGVTQALLAALYIEWREAHPEQFDKSHLNEAVVSVTVATDVAGTSGPATPSTINLTTVPTSDVPPFTTTNDHTAGRE